MIATRADASLHYFCHDESDWSLLELVDWLATSGRRIDNLANFTQALAEKLEDTGLTLLRLRCAFQTLHPQILARASVWQRGQAASLYSFDHGIENRNDYIGSPAEYLLTHQKTYRKQLGDLVNERDHNVLFEVKAEGGTDYLALPVFFRNDEMGAMLMMATDRSGGFSDSDIAKLEILSNHLAPILENFVARDITRGLLDTYVGPRTGDRVMRGLIKRGDSEVIKAALWFSDLRNFTHFTETLPLDDLLSMLNKYFELVAAAVTAQGGEILRFIGDAMLIVFPQEHQNSRRACESALDAAQDAFSSLAAINHHRARSQLPPIEFGVGLHVGEVIYGNVGAPNRLDFTVMGAAVNRTARLESLTKSLNTSLLMSKEFSEHVSRTVHSLGYHEMKGVKMHQEVFALEDLVN